MKNETIPNMCDLQKENSKECEPLISKTSPLIIRLSPTSSKAQQASGDTLKTSKSLAKSCESVKTKLFDLNEGENVSPESELIFEKQSCNSPQQLLLSCDETSKTVKSKNVVLTPKKTQCTNKNIEISKNNDSAVGTFSKKAKFCSTKRLDSEKVVYSKTSDKHKSQSSQSRKRKLSQELQQTSERCQTKSSIDSEKKTQVRTISRLLEPPLVMQSSNMLSDHALDVGHDRGGNATTVLELEMEPSKKKSRDCKYKNNSKPNQPEMELQTSEMEKPAEMVNKTLDSHLRRQTNYLNMDESEKNDNCQVLPVHSLSLQDIQTNETTSHKNVPLQLPKIVSIKEEPIEMDYQTKQAQLLSSENNLEKSDTSDNRSLPLDCINNLQNKHHETDHIDVKPVKEEMDLGKHLLLIHEEQSNNFQLPLVRSLSSEPLEMYKLNIKSETSDVNSQKIDPSSKEGNELSENVKIATCQVEFNNADHAVSQESVAIESSTDVSEETQAQDLADSSNFQIFKAKENRSQRKSRSYRSSNNCSEDAFSCPFKQPINKVHNAHNSSERLKLDVKPSFLSSDDEMDIDDDDVVNLEITELEKMRESLKKQLYQDDRMTDDQDVNYSEGFFYVKTEKIDLAACDESMDSQSYEPADDFIYYNAKESCLEEHISSDSSSVEDEQDINISGKGQFISPEHNEFLSNDIEHNVNPDGATINLREMESLKSMQQDLLQTSGIVKLPSDKGASKTLDETISVANEPPLVMHSSNLLLNDGLDNRHGGGGIETSDLRMDKNFEKILFVDSEDSMSSEKVDNMDNSAADQSSINRKLIESDESASNVAVESQNDGENGVMEFDILDEFESDDNDEDYSDDSDISTDEIDALLEESFKHTKSSTKEQGKDIEHEEKQKVILKVRGRNHFDVLPEGWIEVTHNSGMPIYLHKPSRVCSVSRPYFLGPGSTRKHEIPISAIPCLQYLKELEKEKLSEKISETVSNNTNDGSSEANKSVTTSNVDEESRTGAEKDNGSSAANGLFLSAKLETVKDTKESGSLDYLQLRNYCKKRFEFQTITVKRFRTWSGRRKHQKQIKHKQRPYLPDNTKLITCPLVASDKSTTVGNSTKREFIMNPSGKSPVCILHEYVQHTLRVQPKYVFKELESAKTPYGAVVIIDNVEYGCGFGSSKKLAKSDAAKSALEILIPRMKIFAPDRAYGEEAQDVEFFDQVRVEDPRVCELSIKAGQLYPYQILLECLRRNYGMGDTEIQYKMKNLKHQKNEFYMKVGKHEISVVCKNKRDGKHRASQGILQKLHPHINSWGSLLRMYGKGSCKTMKEKKEEEQRITELQSKACVNKPNMSILNKLKEEMLKYREKVKSKKPIGKLIPERMEFFSTSSSNLKNVEL